MKWAIGFTLFEKVQEVVKGRMWKAQDDLSNFELVFLSDFCCIYGLSPVIWLQLG